MRSHISAAHLLERLGRDEDRGVAGAAGVLPVGGPRRRDVEPLVVLLAEVPRVVTGQPVEGGLGVLVAVEVAGVPRVVLRRGPPQPALALALLGVAHEADRLELAQVVARGAGVGAELGREVGGRGRATAPQRPEQARAQRVGEHPQALGGQPEVVVVGVAGGRRRGRGGVACSHSVHNTSAHFVCTRVVHALLACDVLAGQGRFGGPAAAIWVPPARPVDLSTVVPHRHERPASPPPR